MRLTNMLLAAVGFGMFAANCGGEDAPAKVDMPELDACRLLTAADAGEVLGAPAAEPEHYTRMQTVDKQTGNALSNCLYASDGTFETISVVVSYRRSGNPASFDALRAASKAAGGAMAEITLDMLDASEPVEGLGDFSYWNADAGTLTVYAKGHYEIAVTADGATSGDKASSLARGTDVARRVIARL